MSITDYTAHTRVRFERERDHVWFSFIVYKQSATEWGYELVRANGRDISPTTSDPDFWSEKDAIAAVHSDADFFEQIPGYGWCIRGTAEIPTGHKGSGVVTLPTSKGDADARRLDCNRQGDLTWRIDYPWGDARFLGSAEQVREEMRRNIVENGAEIEPDHAPDEPAGALRP